jgi:predicted AAA+ superfamily ATPase
MLDRKVMPTVSKYIGAFPVLALLGPRQCGKSTLAKEFIKNSDEWIYLDLEKPSDLRKLDDAEYFFNSIGDKRVCIDEVQLRPELFPVLRSIIDENRRAGMIFLLGSASPELLKQGSETLAGRISFLELTPFTLLEVKDSITYRKHWCDGGFPSSALEEDSELSFIWRQSFIRTFVERDIRSLGVQLSPEQLVRLFTMCAHFQGQLFNVANLSKALEISRATINSVLDILQSTFMLRKLESYEANVKKRLVKKPKVYIRDSGILHTLLGIESMEELMGNPSFGNSWEGYCIENILTQHSGWDSFFYRTSHGAEMDLILTRGMKKIAIEIKSSLAPNLTKGFYNAIEDIAPDKTFVVIPEGDSYELKGGITVISLSEFMEIENLKNVVS